MHLFHSTWWISWKLFHHNIRKLIKDDKFINSMNDLELRAWTLLAWWKNFLGNHQVENYKELVEKLLKSLQNIGANMNIKVHFIHSHLDKFPDNCGNVSDEQEQFHQDIQTMEEHYQGWWDCCMTEKDNNADIWKYNLLLFFSFYYLKCMDGWSERGLEMTELAHIQRGLLYRYSVNHFFILPWLKSFLIYLIFWMHIRSLVIIHPLGNNLCPVYFRQHVQLLLCHPLNLYSMLKGSSSQYPTETNEWWLTTAGLSKGT